MGLYFTIFATIEGIVKYETFRRDKRRVHVELANGNGHAVKAPPPSIEASADSGATA
jgi:hypothetical protein